MNDTLFDVSTPLSDLRQQPSRSFSRQQKAVLTVISAAIALLSHVLFLFLLPEAFQRNQSSDYFAYYEPVAQRLASGGGLFLGSKPALLYPPGIPLMYAATFRLSDALRISRTAGLRLLEALVLSLTSIVVTLIALFVLNWRAALVASTLWSTYPFHLWLTKQPDPTSAISLLLLLGIFLFLKWLIGGRRSVQYGCSIGIVLGIAALIKPSVIGLPLVIAGLSYICAVPCRPQQRTVFSVSVILAYIIVILPWEVWARNMSGHWIILGTNGPNALIDGLTFGTVRGLKPVWMPQNVRQLVQDVVEHYSLLKSTTSIVSFIGVKVREQPITVAELFLIKAGRTWYSNETHTWEKWILVIQLIYLPFVLVGARQLLKRDRLQRDFVAILCTIILYFWLIAVFISLPLLRYLIPGISLLMIVAACAFEASAIQFRFPFLAKGVRIRP